MMQTTKTKTPRDMRAHIQDVFGELSGELQKAARYVVDHPAEVAMRSMRSISSDANLHPSTLVRFARRLGFESYGEFRSQFRSDVRYQLGSFGEKARSLQARAKPSQGMQLMDELLETELSNLRATAAVNSISDLDSCAEILAAAERIFVIGRRSFFPAAYLFHFTYSMFADNAYLGADQSGTSPSALARLTSKDVLLAFSFDPYATEVVNAVHHARERGCPVIAVTDSPLSPIARSATISLLAKNDSPSFFQSVMSSLLIVQYLTIALLIRRGTDGSAALEATEAGLRALKVYWPLPDVGSGNL